MFAIIRSATELKEKLRWLFGAFRARGYVQLACRRKIYTIFRLEGFRSGTRLEIADYGHVLSSP